MRLLPLALLAGVLSLGCDDVYEDAPPADLMVDGEHVGPPPDEDARPPMAPPDEPFDPPLAIPGEEDVHPPAPPPGMVPGALAPPATLPLVAGFQPDPLVLRGHAGGTTDAAKFGCPGVLPDVPSQILEVRAPFAQLRLVVRAPGDTMMVLVGPAGAAHCANDEGEQQNPLFRGRFAPGVYQVFVGLPTPGPPLPYVLAVTTNPAIGASTLPAPAAP